MNEFEKFKNIAILEDLTEDQISVLFKRCRRVTFDKNDVIMEENEDKHSMFFFIDGEVIVSNLITMKVSNQAGYSEAEKSLVRLRAEVVGILGEMSVFDSQPRSATVKAFEPCVLYEIGREEFEKLIMEHPEIGTKLLFNIAKILCVRVRRGNSDILKLTTALSIALSK
ncbi:MAG TPA: cyclic nucleotide-binding domain-containing protein [Spirochaetota bacterium]|nr:cyclic nucleotide-binding domain-containing protein [Spirochaetota bacterium]HPQ52850.1 cyclic nucleotide-binding domain-containing protein [Spirochaetota bacterium]